MSYIMKQKLWPKISYSLKHTVLFYDIEFFLIDLSSLYKYLFISTFLNICIFPILHLFLDGCGITHRNEVWNSEYIFHHYEVIWLLNLDQRSEITRVGEMSYHDSWYYASSKEENQLVTRILIKS